MMHLFHKKITQYLLFLAFSIPVLSYLSVIIETQKAKQQTLPLLVNAKNSQKTVVSDLITIDNFPVKNGSLSSRYGMRKDPINGKRRMHSGIDIAARKGTSIYPLGKGKIIFVGRKAGYGKTVEILHGRTIITRYSHLKKALVTVGQEVSKKDIIAQVGNSGRSTGPHLHLEIAINGKTVDPQIFLIGNLASR